MQKNVYNYNIYLYTYNIHQFELLAYLSLHSALTPVLQLNKLTFLSVMLIASFPYMAICGSITKQPDRIGQLCVDLLTTRTASNLEWLCVILFLFMAIELLGG